jgi:SNF2 family DNA or RNA helicase
LGKPYDPQRESIERENLKEEGKFVSDSELSERFVEEREVPCEQCQATGKVDEYVREAQQVPTPKEDALIDILEDHEDIGRLVVYAGFTGSIERVCSIVKKVGWEYVRMDGKGIQTSFDLKSYPVEGVSDTEHALACFQKVGTQGPEKLVFIGHPQSAGMGLTLTAAPTTVYWSNDFNAESRIQSEDRIHRAGMDKNRGATIVDLIHLDTDQLVLDNLQKKRDLQAITLGEVQKNMEKSLEEAERR